MDEYIGREAFIEMAEDIFGSGIGSLAAMIADCIPAADVVPMEHEVLQMRADVKLPEDRFASLVKTGAK